MPTMPTIADFSLATLEKLLWSIGNADASVFDEVPTDTLVMASQQLKKAKTEDDDGPTVSSHSRGLNYHSNRSQALSTLVWIPISGHILLH